jgi:hypothetical protein
MGRDVNAECPVVAKMADRAMELMDREELMSVVLAYQPTEEMRMYVGHSLVDDFHLDSSHAEALSGKADEIIGALARRLGLLN